MYLYVALVPWAVILVDEHRVADVIHLNILEMHVGGGGDFRVGPRLDPDAVLRADEGAIPDEDTFHGFLILVLSKTSNADSVARAAGHARHDDLSTTVANGDAVVPGLDLGIFDGDPRGSPDVDTVRVRAILRGRHSKVLEGEIVAAQNIYVKLFAVECGYAIDRTVADEIESQILSNIILYVT